MRKYIYTHTHKYLTLFGGLMSALTLILASPDERVKLLRAGVTGKQIEKLFVELNHFKIVGAILYDPDAQPTNLSREGYGQQVDKEA